MELACLVRIPDYIERFFRNESPADGRARLVYFTPKGMDWLDDFRRALLRAEAEVAKTIGAQALHVTKHALSRYIPPSQATAT